MPNMDLEGLFAGLKMQLDNMSVLLGRFLADCKAAEKLNGEEEKPPQEIKSKREPAPLTLDQVKAAAITYAQKHGRAALMGEIKKFAEDEKLSSIPEGKRSAFVKGIQ
jgi:hypothetical protein